MNSDRIKEIQETTAYPDSVSVKQALLQVWKECAQENSKNDKVRAFAMEVIDMINDRILYAKDDGREIKDLCWLENKLLATVESLIPKEEEKRIPQKGDTWRYKGKNEDMIFDEVRDGNCFYHYIGYNGQTQCTLADFYEMFEFVKPKEEEVDSSKDKIIDECKKQFPIGSMFKCANGNNHDAIVKEYYWRDWRSSHGCFGVTSGNGWLFLDGKFAKVVEPEKKECEKWCGENYCDENGCTNRKRILVEPDTLELHPTTPKMQEQFVKANPEMNFSEESNKLKESEFQKTAYSDEVKDERINITSKSESDSIMLGNIENDTEMFTKKDLIDLVEGLKHYTHESRTILGLDEREAVEFVDIFLDNRKQPTTPETQEAFKKANPEMKTESDEVKFSEEVNKLKESEFQKTAYSDEVKVIKKMIDYIKHDSEIMIPSERLMRINGEHITKKEYGLIMLEILCEELEQKFLPHYTLEQNSRKKAEETIDSFMKSWNGHAPLREYKEELIAELDKAFKFDPKKLS